MRNREAKVGGGCQGTERDVGRDTCGDVKRCQARETFVGEIKKYG